MNKTSLPPSSVHALLAERFGEVAQFERLAEGLDSQAFGFRRDSTGYVIRINRATEGFNKDLFACHSFARPALPIPEIIEIGRINHDHAFCISRRAPGVRVHDLTPTALRRIVTPIEAIIAAIAGTDLSGTTGFGCFDAGGTGSSPSWSAYVTAVADSRHFDWAACTDRVDRAVIDQAVGLVERLAEYCPEERHLIHGDFGSYNLMTDGRIITAVIDWDRALIGDPLYEIANLFFWREACLAPLLRELEAASAPVPNAQERLACYQIRIALQEIYEGATAGAPVDLDWLTLRCRAIIEEAA